MPKASLSFLAVLVAALPLAGPATSVAKSGQHVRIHRLLIQVDQNDPAVMNLALNNATNVAQHYRDKGEEADIEIVAYGPGLNMLRADASPVADRIKDMKDLAFPGRVAFAACGVTKAAMEKKEGKTIGLLPEVALVPSGVVRLMERQELGWSYVRP
jgi:uncharacterized protein